MRLGILGGTFDPIHTGHLIVAEEARVQLNLARVLFVPTGQPWMKAEEPLSEAQHRLNMVMLATANNSCFEVSALEIDRPGPSYTVDTLEELQRERGPGNELFFILGQDSLKTFPRWRKPCRILEMCPLVAVSRPGSEALAPDSLEQQCPGASQRVVQLNGPLISISGTEIRQRVAQGLSIRYLVPREVEGYIYRNGLYRRSGDAP